VTAGLELAPASVAAAIDSAELARLLGMPRTRPLEGLVLERAEWAREWYGTHGRPFVHARRHDVVERDAERVRLEGGLEFRSRALSDHLERFEAHGLVGLAISAGPEVDAAGREMWQDGRPDEGYFLERFAVAVVEHLAFSATLWACQSAERSGETLTPHLSPGCGAWELDQQHTLWNAIFPHGALGPIRLLASGGLEPKNSMLAAAGVTRRAPEASPLEACRRCELPRCSFRRAPYRPQP
jgi:hypothetical protein